MMSVSVFSLDVAKKEGLEIQIETGELEDTHPNTAEITLTAADGEKVSLRGSSIGGGNILITRVNGMEVALTGQNPALIVLHKDAPGTDCCGYRADGRVWGEYLQFPPGA